MSAPVRFALIGTAWRAEFFARIARELPERFEITGCYSRNAEKRAGFAKTFGLADCASIDALLATQPEFVVLSVPRAVSGELILELAAKGAAVLGETPPAEKIADMTQLWQRLPAGARVQIAEQYPFQPHHAARLAFAASGRLGTVTQAQVSAAHGYHGMVLIRRFLGVGFEPAEISAMSFKSPLVQGRGREPGPKEEKVIESGQVIAQMRFGDKLGVFDFTGDQYFSWIRSQRLLVRGERGEINNFDAAYLADFKTPVPVRFERQDAGHGGNLEGLHLKGYVAGGEWWYRNPFTPARLYDDEIAVASCLDAMAEYVRTGKSFYSLAEACQDHYLALLIEEALAQGKAVQTAPQVSHPASSRIRA